MLDVLHGLGSEGSNPNALDIAIIASSPFISSGDDVPLMRGHSCTRIYSFCVVIRHLWLSALYLQLKYLKDDNQWLLDMNGDENDCSTIDSEASRELCLRSPSFWCTVRDDATTPHHLTGLPVPPLMTMRPNKLFCSDENRDGNMMCRCGRSISTLDPKAC